MVLNWLLREPIEHTPVAVFRRIVNQFSWCPKRSRLYLVSTWSSQRVVERRRASQNVVESIVDRCGNLWSKPLQWLLRQAFANRWSSSRSHMKFGKAFKSARRFGSQNLMIQEDSEGFMIIRKFGSRLCVTTIGPKVKLSKFPWANSIEFRILPIFRTQTQYRFDASPLSYTTKCLTDRWLVRCFSVG